MYRKVQILYELGYCLNLGLNLKWHIKSTQRTKSWVDKFALIMGLKACSPNGSPQLLFLESVELQNYSTQMKDYKLHNLKSTKVWFDRNSSNIICEISCQDDNKSDIIEMLETVNSVYYRVQITGGIPLHASLIERDGIGIALAGSSNTGKSTCCSRIPPPWHAVCDDETLVIPDTHNQYRIHPFPTWSEYHINKHCKSTWKVETSIPLSAIFFLEQANSDEVLLIGKGKAAVFISQNAIEVYNRMWGESKYKEETIQKNRLFDNACRIIETVPTYILRASLNGNFWNEIEKVL